VDLCAGGIGSAAGAKPVDLAHQYAVAGERRSGADHHMVAGGVQADDVQGVALVALLAADAKAFPLADRVVDDAVMTAHHAAVDMDDVAGFYGAGAELFHHLGV
jgi:hypothetical protein